MNSINPDYIRQTFFLVQQVLYEKRTGEKPGPSELKRMRESAYNRDVRVVQSNLEETKTEQSGEAGQIRDNYFQVQQVLYEKRTGEKPGPSELKRMRESAYNRDVRVVQSNLEETKTEQSGEAGQIRDNYFQVQQVLYEKRTGEKPGPSELKRMRESAYNRDVRAVQSNLEETKTEHGQVPPNSTGGNEATEVSAKPQEALASGVSIQENSGRTATIQTAADASVESSTSQPHTASLGEPASNLNSRPEAQLTTAATGPTTKSNQTPATISPALASAARQAWAEAQTSGAKLATAISTPVSGAGARQLPALLTPAMAAAARQAVPKDIDISLSTSKSNGPTPGASSTTKIKTGRELGK